MEIRLSVDDETLTRVQERAAAAGKTLDEVVGEYLKEYSSETWGEAFVRLSGGGDSGGSKWNREEIYEERLGRYPQR